MGFSFGDFTHGVGSVVSAIKPVAQNFSPVGVITAAGGAAKQTLQGTGTALQGAGTGLSSVFSSLSMPLTIGVGIAVFLMISK